MTQRAALACDSLPTLSSISDRIPVHLENPRKAVFPSKRTNGPVRPASLFVRVTITENYSLFNAFGTE